MRNLDTWWRSPLTTLAITLAGVMLVSCADNGNAMSCSATPGFFCAEFAKMQSEIPAHDQDVMKNTPEKDLGKFHLSIGMAVRNQEGLWKDNEITQFFKSHGAEHPDEMSYILLVGFSRYLRGQTVNMEDVTHHVVVDLRPPNPPLQPQGDGEHRAK